jgi:hypothetical protein
MVDYAFLWLEVNGFRRISKAIQYVMISYMTLIIGGLALAVALNVLALALGALIAATGMKA